MEKELREKLNVDLPMLNVPTKMVMESCESSPCWCVFFINRMI